MEQQGSPPPIIVNWQNKINAWMGLNGGMKINQAIGALAQLEWGKGESVFLARPDEDLRQHLDTFPWTVKSRFPPADTYWLVLRQTHHTPGG